MYYYSSMFIIVSVGCFDATSIDAMHESSTVVPVSIHQNSVNLLRKRTAYNNIKRLLQPAHEAFKNLLALDHASQILSNCNFHGLMRLIEETHKAGALLPAIARTIIEDAQRYHYEQWAYEIFEKEYTSLIGSYLFYVTNLVNKWVKGACTENVRQQMVSNDKSILDSFVREQGEVFRAINSAHDLIKAVKKEEERVLLVE